MSTSTTAATVAGSCDTGGDAAAAAAASATAAAASATGMPVQVQANVPVWQKHLLTMRLFSGLVPPPGIDVPLVPIPTAWISSLAAAEGTVAALCKKRVEGAMPFLYPGPAGYITDVSEFGLRWAREGNSLTFENQMEMMNDIFGRLVDYRLQALISLYDTSIRALNSKMPDEHTLPEHEVLFRRAGLGIVFLKTEHRPSDTRHVSLKWLSAASRAGVTKVSILAPYTLAEVKELNPEMVYKCSKSDCINTCHSQCVCGTHYCSEECQAADWSGHRPSCRIPAPVVYWAINKYWLETFYKAIAKKRSEVHEAGAQPQIQINSSLQTQTMTLAEFGPQVAQLTAGFRVNTRLHAHPNQAVIQPHIAAERKEAVNEIRTLLRLKGSRGPFNVVDTPNGFSFIERDSDGVEHERSMSMGFKIPPGITLN
jgi:hypothetical protein